MIKISPSILSCDYSKMGEELNRMKDCGADWIHFDVMDGHFVPNLTIGVAVVSSLRKISGIFFDVHLMISEPLKYIEPFAQAGADLITFHVEADSDIRQTIEAIKSAGCKAALSVKPKTPASEVFDYLDLIDMVLVMTVEPGFGGQSFMADMMPKVREIRNECNRRGLKMEIQVDGGINENNISEAARAGANVFVSGSTIFSAKDSGQMIKMLKENAEKSYID
ncbi:MAG: ribulose-phosphate 3-epimerase [Oscillospiraceae bacterium]